MSLLEPIPVPRLRELRDADVLPALQREHLPLPAIDGHAPRILLLYGSLRERSYSRLAVE